jgi:ABC-2 type transport system permease protein
MFDVFIKTIRDKKAFIFGWSMGFAALGYLMMIFYPAFHQDNGLDEILKGLPKAFEGLIGNISDLKQLPSYIGSQLFEVRIPVFVSISAIILAISLTVAEEEKGQLRTLLALPLSRTRVLVGKWLGIVAIMFIITIGTVIGLELGLLSIHETLDLQVILRLCAITWLLGVAIATVVFGIGLGTGKRAAAMTIGVLVAAGSFIMSTFAMSVEWLEPYEKFSILHYFQAVNVSKSHIEMTDVAVYTAIIVILLAVGIVGFRRRDVR